MLSEEAILKSLNDLKIEICNRFDAMDNRFDAMDNRIEAQFKDVNFALNVILDEVVLTQKLIEQHEKEFHGIMKTP